MLAQTCVSWRHTPFAHCQLCAHGSCTCAHLSWPMALCSMPGLGPLRCSHLLCLAGGPGSGKGTQSAKIAAHFGLICISVGEILRSQMLHHATSDQKWELIAQIIANGELAPPETTIEQLKQQFLKQQDARGFVVDGFPREIGQAFTFEEQIGSPDLVVFLACSSQRFRQRLEKRALEQGRLDDNPHAIERRVDTFKQNVPLIVKYYQEKGVIIRVSSVVQAQLYPDGMDKAGEGGC
uniref:Nucleoside-diphosphate kinase n=1 Tax=Crocodylus porosus TaxID=8502 RepID=A0A7M4DV14_CROPO